MSVQPLVVFFSNTGTTQKLAEYIAESANGILCPLKLEKEYSKTYLVTCWNGFTDYWNDVKPKLVETALPDISKHDVIFIGYPIWAYNYPRVIDSFINHYGKSVWEGKRIVPFCTYGSSGVGKSAPTLKENLPGSTHLEPFGASRSEVGTARDNVVEWIQKLNL